MRYTTFVFPVTREIKQMPSLQSIFRCDCALCKTGEKKLFWFHQPTTSALREMQIFAKDICEVHWKTKGIFLADCWKGNSGKAGIDRKKSICRDVRTLCVDKKFRFLASQLVWRKTVVFLWEKKHSVDCCACHIECPSKKSNWKNPIEKASLLIGWNHWEFSPLISSFFLAKINAWKWN